MSKKLKKPLKKEQHECSFCNKVYLNEKSFQKHLCKQKKRYLERDKQDARFGFIAYSEFYKIQYRSRRKEITSEQFRNSNTYDAFVDFGKYIISVNAISPKDFIQYVINNNKPLDKWCTDSIYMEYVRSINKTESCDRAIERMLLLAESWANKEKHAIVDFFRLISPAQALHWMISGRISPWTIFNCQSGNDLIEKYTDEQLTIMNSSIDMKFWRNVFLKDLQQTKKIRDFLTDEGF